MLGINSKHSNSETGSVNLIGGGTKILGDIDSQGDIRIDGKLIGNLTTNGKFVLGIHGSVEGNVTCTNADISGEIKGTVNISETLSLKKELTCTPKNFFEFPRDYLVLYHIECGGIRTPDRRLWRSLL